MGSTLLYSIGVERVIIMDVLKFELYDIISLYTKNNSDQKQSISSLSKYISCYVIRFFY